MTVTIPASPSRAETWLNTLQLRILYGYKNGSGEGFDPADAPGCLTTEVFEDPRDDGISVYLDQQGKIVLVGDANGPWVVAIGDDELKDLLTGPDPLFVT